MHAGDLFCCDKNDVEMYQRYLIFGPFCNTFALLFLLDPYATCSSSLLGAHGVYKSHESRDESHDESHESCNESHGESRYESHDESRVSHMMSHMMSHVLVT